MPRTGSPHRNRAVHVLLSALLAVFIASCSEPRRAAEPATNPDVRRSGSGHRPARLEPDDCPMDIPETVTVKVDCGWLVVPENRRKPRSDTIKLAVARLHSRAAHPRADPVVNLQGGPGFPSLDNILNAASSAVLDERDYILWDQRGVGFSQPNIDCTETNDAIWAAFATTDSAEVEGKRLDASMAACRNRLIREGIDLDGYNTVENADDLADLRVALGVTEWNLRGVSYGSALAMEAMRRHPEGIRSVLLDSVVPPDAAGSAVERGAGALRAFSELYGACASDRGCSAKYGDLGSLARRAAASLDADPYRTTVEDPGTGTRRPVSITGGDLWAGLFNAMYDEQLIPAIPAFLAAIVSGQRGLIDAVAADGIPFAAGQAEGMTASVTCADRERLLDPKPFDGFVRQHPELAILMYLVPPELGCPRWGVKPAPSGFNALLRQGDTHVRTLVMAGRFDPVTPPAGAQRVADALGVPLLLFPGAGHGAVGSSPCARSIWLAFLDDPESPPDTGCMAALGPPTFG